MNHPSTVFAGFCAYIHTQVMSDNRSYAMKTLPSFDELKALAEKDPQELEMLRIEMSEAFIATASKRMQPTLRAQLSHINRVIETGKNPNQINVLLMKELIKKFSHFSTALNNPESMTNKTASVTTLQPRSNLQKMTTGN